MGDPSWSSIRFISTAQLEGASASFHRQITELTTSKPKWRIDLSADGYEQHLAEATRVARELGCHHVIDLAAPTASVITACYPAATSAEQEQFLATARQNYFYLDNMWYRVQYALLELDPVNTLNMERWYADQFEIDGIGRGCKLRDFLRAEAQEYFAQRESQDKTIAPEHDSR